MPESFMSQPLPFPDFSDMAYVDTIPWLNLESSPPIAAGFPSAGLAEGSAQRGDVPPLSPPHTSSTRDEGPDSASAGTLSAQQQQQQQQQPLEPPRNEPQGTCTCTAQAHLHFTAIAQPPRPTSDQSGSTSHRTSTTTTTTTTNTTPNNTTDNGSDSSIIPSPALAPIQRLRAATRAAEQLLTCAVCFDTSRGHRGVSGNVYLLSALLASVASSYAQFWDCASSPSVVGGGGRGRGDAGGGARSASDDGYGLVPLRVSVVGEGQPVELRVGRDEYLVLVRAGVRADATRLSVLCDRFAERQVRFHSEGHEACTAEACLMKDDARGSGLDRHMRGICPRAADITGYYRCFQAVGMVRSSIAELRSVLDDTLASPERRG